MFEKNELNRCLAIQKEPAESNPGIRITQSINMIRARLIKLPAQPLAQTELK